MRLACAATGSRSRCLWPGPAATARRRGIPPCQSGPSCPSARARLRRPVIRPGTGRDPELQWLGPSPSHRVGPSRPLECRDLADLTAPTRTVTPGGAGPQAGHGGPRSRAGSSGRVWRLRTARPDWPWGTCARRPVRRSPPPAWPPREEASPEGAQTSNQPSPSLLPALSRALSPSLPPPPASSRGRQRRHFRRRARLVFGAWLPPCPRVGAPVRAPLRGLWRHATPLAADPPAPRPGPLARAARPSRRALLRHGPVPWVRPRAAPPTLLPRPSRRSRASLSRSPLGRHAAPSAPPSSTSPHAAAAAAAAHLCRGGGG